MAKISRAKRQGLSSSLSTTDIQKTVSKKPYFFCARIPHNYLIKLNALMYTSHSTHADFLTSIIIIFDWLCHSNQQYLIQKIFGKEFYDRFIENYLENLFLLEQEKFKEENAFNEESDSLINSSQPIIKE